VYNNDACSAAQEVLTRDTECNNAFTGVMNTIPGTAINQTNKYLATLCKNDKCADTISTYFSACQSLIVSAMYCMSKIKIYEFHSNEKKNG